MAATVVGLEEEEEAIDIRFKFVKQQMEKTQNLASEAELLEQAVIAWNAFKEVNSSANGQLSFKELRQVCDVLGLPLEADESEALSKMDSDGSQTLDMEEWLSWWLKRTGCCPNPAKQMEALARNTFQKFDTDGSGELDMQEFKALLAALGAKFTDKETREAMQELDTDGGGTIGIDEFIDWWANRANSNRKGGGGLMAMKLRKLANKANQMYFTDVFTATWGGDVDLVKVFLDSDPRIGSASDVSEFGDGFTPLHYACYRGHSAIVEALLGAGVAPNKTTDQGFTPLFYAGQQGHLDICRMLLESGADPSIYGTCEELPDIFLCVADHAQDNAELEALLRPHERCKPPDAVPIEKLTATVNAVTSTLTVELPSLRGVSALPIKKWVIELQQGSETPLFLSVPAKIPTNLHLEVPLDKKWLKSLLGLENVRISMRISAVNALKDQGPLSDDVLVEYVAAPASKMPTPAPSIVEEQKSSEPAASASSLLRDLFSLFDGDGDGLLDKHELILWIISQQACNNREEPTKISYEDHLAIPDEQLKMIQGMFFGASVEPFRVPYEAFEEFYLVRQNLDTDEAIVAFAEELSHKFGILVHVAGLASSAGAAEEETEHQTDRK